MIDFQQEVKTLVRKAIMEEINNLAIRATMREKIEAAGVSHDDIRNMVTETIDSYMRSAMNGDVAERIKEIFDRKVSEAVAVQINKIIGSIWGWEGERKVKEALQKEIDRKVSRGFDLSISIKPKENTDEV